MEVEIVNKTNYFQSFSDQSLFHSSIQQRNDEEREEDQQINHVEDDWNEEYLSEIFSEAEDKSYLMMDSSLSSFDSIQNEDSMEKRFEKKRKLEQENEKEILTKKKEESSKDWEDCSLPEIVKNLYREKGITKQYSWQKECLTNLMRFGRNLVVSLPTSGGKTLVAEMMIMKTVLNDKKKAIMVLPYVSIVMEKSNQLNEFGNKLNFNVEGYYGGHGTIPLPHTTHVAICTIEKAHSLINQLIEEERLIKEVGLIVVDELHMLDENDRGFVLELLLTKILYMGKGGIQIIGMSATIPNVVEIANWLLADCYISDFRPVPLVEMLFIDNSLYSASGEHLRDVLVAQSPLVQKKSKEMQEIFQLTWEVVSNSEQSVLIFCGTKNETQDVALNLSQMFDASVSLIHKEEKDLLIQKLKFCNSGGLDPTLCKTIYFGIAFHNSSLTADERELIEEAYSNRILNIIVSTSTLAAGVNLPARRVILKNMFVGRNVLNNRVYKQMCGRAGRAGIDSYGESVLISKRNQHSQASQLMNSQLDKVKSCLCSSSRKGLKRLVLDAIGGRYASTKKGVLDFISCSLFAYQSSLEDIEEEVDRALFFLKLNGFINIGKCEETVEDTISTTLLGNATFHSSFSPEIEALLVELELKKALRSLILEDPLHMCYLITPMWNLPLIEDWDNYEDIFSQLTPPQKKIAELVGVTEGFIGRQALEEKPISLNDPKQSSNPTLRSATRFYFALVLSDLIEESPIFQVSKRYKVNRGSLQALMMSAQSFASQIVNFCRTMDFWSLEAVLSTYCKRLNFGTKMDIVPLTEIPGVKKQRARSLYNAGFRTVRQIALATPEELVKNTKLGPFGDGIARKIIRNAKELLERKAKELREQADELLLIEK